MTYAAIVGVDNLLRDKTPMPPMKSALFVSRSRKRITDLTPEDCNDAECFEYLRAAGLERFLSGWLAGVNDRAGPPGRQKENNAR